MFIPIIIVFITSLYLLRSTLFIITVRGTSMEPRLNPGDRVIALRYCWRRFLSRGSIIVFQINSKSSRRDLYIKIVTGLPGDTIITHIDQLAPYQREERISFYDENGERTWFVPPGHLFVESLIDVGGYDSRLSGPIRSQQVFGYVIGKLR